MTDQRSTDPDSTQRHEVPAEPARPPVIRASGEAESYSPPPTEARPDWTRHDAAPSTSPTPERWYEPAATVPATPVAPSSVSSSRSGRGVGTVLGAALLSAVLASGGTVVALSASGALESRRDDVDGAYRHDGRCQQPAGHDRRVVGDDRRRRQGQPGRRADHRHRQRAIPRRGHP